MHPTSAAWANWNLIWAAIAVNRPMSRQTISFRASGAIADFPISIRYFRFPMYVAYRLISIKMKIRKINESIHLRLNWIVHL